MSNLLINIRFFWWHLQISDNWKLSITYNKYHKNLPEGLFQIYVFKFKK